MRINRERLVGESRTLALNAVAESLKKNGIKMINLTAGELDFETPPEIQKAVAKELGKNKYTPTLGLPELRENIAKHVSARSRWRVTAKNVAVTAGGKQGLFQIFQLILKKGDEVIIPTPAWVSYEEQVRLAGGRPVFAPMGKISISRKTRAVVINSPQNPTGKVLSKKDLREKSAALREKGVWVVSDEIYSELVFDDTKKDPASRVLDKKNLIVVGGFSKSHALTGWRVGYVVGPEEVIRAMGAFQSHASGNASLMGQYAALAALHHPEIPKKFVEVLRKRREIALREIEKIPKIRCVPPDGAFYCFLDIRKIEKSGERFCGRLLRDHRVAAVPGEAFRVPGHIRISFAASEENIKEGIKRIGRCI